MKDSPKHQFTLKNISVETLGYQHILRHSPEIVNRTAIQTVVALNIEVNFGLFSNNKASLGFPDVIVEQIGQDILLQCPCQSSSSCMCEHETVVLYALLEKPALRLFFDKKLRTEKIKLEAQKYGFLDDSNLEQHFKLVFQQNQVEIKPILNELIALDENKLERLKSELVPVSKFKTLEPNEVENQLSVVFSKNKYSDGFSVDLITHNLTQEGKIKNPLQLIEPLDLSLKTDQLADLKFFAAVSRFQKGRASLFVDGQDRWLYW